MEELLWQNFHLIYIKVIFHKNLIFFKAGPDVSKYEDPKKIPDELKVPVEEWERKKMEDLLIVATKWERDD